MSVEAPGEPAEPEEDEEEAHVASEPELKPERNLKNLREVAPATTEEALSTSNNRFEHFKAMSSFSDDERSAEFFCLSLYL